MKQKVQITDKKVETIKKTAKRKISPFTGIFDGPEWVASGFEFEFDETHSWKSRKIYRKSLRIDRNNQLWFRSCINA